MDSTRKIALIFGLSWIIIKLVIFNLGYAVELFTVTAMVNLLFLLLVIFFTLHFRRQKGFNIEKVEFLSDLKEAMKAGSIYTIIFAGFILVYFSAIDPNFAVNRMEMQGIIAPENIDFDAIKAQNPIKLKDLSKEDFLLREAETRALFASPLLVSTLFLAGMMLISLFYSFLTVIFYRKVLSKLR